MKQQAAQRFSSPGTTQPLVMPDQRLDRQFIDPSAPVSTQGTLSLGLLMVWFSAALLCAILVSLLLRSLQGAAMPTIGVLMLCGVVIVPFFWVAFAAAIAIAGLFWRGHPTTGTAQPLRIAILVLLFDEPPDPVISRAVRLLASLDGRGIHSFSLYVLSDSRQFQSVQRERAVYDMALRQHGNLDLSYVHREANTDFKSGNIRKWIRSFGQSHDAMLLLDSDSVMDAEGVNAMANALSADPRCALVQSVPRVLPGQTRWQSMQSFASHCYGVNLGRGLDVISGPAANFYGHNAIVRTRAFADCAGLPHLAGEPPFGGVIMSHDFVEAALLRRAGWSVRFMPAVKGSFEESPETLAAHLARDRRWCHGNLQHLGLLGVPGFAVMSRFHLLQGAMTYISAPLWLVAVALWTTVSVPPLSGALLFPLLLITLVLLLPRVCGLVPSASRLTAHDLAFALQELIFSSLLAPLLLMQRTLMIFSIVFGTASVWERPKNDQMSMTSAIRFHRFEITLAMVFFACWMTGLVSPLIFTAAVPLLLAPLLNQAVSKRHTNQILSPPHDNQ